MENGKVVASETMVTLYTWEHPTSQARIESVPLPHAVKMANHGGFYMATVILESGEIYLEK